MAVEQFREKYLKYDDTDGPAGRGLVLRSEALLRRVASALCSNRRCFHASWRRVHGEYHLARSLTNAGRHNAHNAYTDVSFMPQSYDGIYFGGTHGRI